MAKRKAAATAASSRRANSPTSGTRPAVAAQVPQGKRLHDFVRTIPDRRGGKPRRRVVEQHTLTAAEAAAWQKLLREQGFKDAEFVPAK